MNPFRLSCHLPEGYSWAKLSEKDAKSLKHHEDPKSPDFREAVQLATILPPTPEVFLWGGLLGKNEEDLPSAGIRTETYYAVTIQLDDRTVFLGWAQKEGDW